MQLDFEYDIYWIVVKCKNRDIRICSKIRCKKSDTILIKQNINYYSDSLRYYSFGFLEKIDCIPNGKIFFVILNKISIAKC